MTTPITATQITQLNNLLDLLEDANDYAQDIGTDSVNVNIRGHIQESRSAVHYQLGKLAAAHIRQLHKAGGYKGV